MKISFSFPSADRLNEFLQQQKKDTYSYKEIGATQTDKVKTYDNDHRFICLGEGELVWQKAKSALQQWQQFPKSWTKAIPATSGIQQNDTVAVLFKLLGIWWLNSARIVYTLDEENRYGCAYGTLNRHIECGEECFWIERGEDGKVFYHIKAFSKPARWYVWLGYPFARYHQRRFARQSLAQMKTICA